MTTILWVMLKRDMCLAEVQEVEDEIRTKSMITALNDLSMGKVVPIG